MDLSKFVGRSFVASDDGRVATIKSANGGTFYVTSVQRSGNMNYTDIKECFEKNLIEFIHTDSWVIYGSKVAYDASSLFNEAENIGYREYTLPLDLKNYQISINSIAHSMLNIRCECGGNKIGLKDYQVGHLRFCNVYHGNKK